MKRSHIALMLTLVFVVIGLGYYLNPRPQIVDAPASPPTPVPQVQPKVLTRPTATGKVFAPRHNTKVPATIPTRCMSSVYALYELRADSKISDLVEDVASHCETDADVTEAGDALKTCKSKEECDLAFAVLRTLIVDNIAKKIPIQDIDDPLLLLERLQLRYDFSSESRHENIALAKRLVELEPDYYPAHKFLAVNEYYALKEASTPEEREKHWQEFWQTSQTMQDKNNEADLENRLEVEVLTIHARAPAADQMHDMLNKMQQAHPDAAVLSFYQGMVAYKSGDVEAAKKWFVDAKAKDRSNDHRFQAAIELTEGKDVDPALLGPQIRVDW